MKLYAFAIAALSFVLLAAANTATAQTTYSPALDKYVNTTTGGLWNSESSAMLDGMINSPTLDMQRQMLANAIMNDAIRRDAGIAKIKAGRATTRIQYSAQNSLAEQMAARAKTPAEAKATREAVTVALTTFNNILKSKRLTPYDAADGDALSFVLSYIVFHGEDPGDARLIKFRDQVRAQTLTDQLYQGTSEADKQIQYESLVFRTMLAVKASQQSKSGDARAAETAKSYATGVFKELWIGEPANIVLVNDGYGFAGRGDVIIASGKAVTTFTRSNKVLTASEFANQYGKYERTIEQWMSEFDAEVKRRGGATNDAAWVNAVGFALAYEVYTDNKVKLNQAQFDWVLKEMQKDILSSSAYQAMSDEDRQKYYERIAIPVMEDVVDYRQTGNSSVMPKMKAETRLMIIFEPRKFYDYSLTPTGFVKK